MKNLLSNLWTSTKFLGIILVTGGIAQNIMTYNFVQENISKAEKTGNEYAKKYCKMTLKNSYKSSRISKFVDGGDDAAREYLELIELNK